MFKPSQPTNINSHKVKSLKQSIMSIIDEIKQARANQLTAEQKEKILAYIKFEMMYDTYAVIGGASHYGEWKERNGRINEAPYRYHPAIADWLHTLGFHTSRYYNRGGVDNGLKVWF